MDRERGETVLFNDRYGMHRLYYHESPDALYFASEAKALLALLPDLRKLDMRGLGEFVSCGAVLENRTLFQGIHVLPPGSAWTFRQGRLEKKDAYFSPSTWEQQEMLGEEQAYQRLRAAFSACLPQHFGGDEPIGLSLTGGLDTRLILACHPPQPGQLPCYTFGSMFHENQDVRVARRVANACGQSHQVLTASQDFLAQFHHYAERAIYLTDGCVDVSRAPDLYLNERARQIAPVRMTGLYGGEILRGVRTFKPQPPAPGLFAGNFLSHFEQAKQTYERLTQCHPVTFAAYMQGPWHLRGSLALEETQLSMRTPFLDNDFLQAVYHLPATALAGDEVSLRLIRDGNPALARIPTDRGLHDPRTSLRSRMAHAALEFQFKAEYAYDMGMPQWLARIDHALRPLHMERLFLGRHKPFHFRVWYRDQLAGYLREVLLEERSLARPYLERHGVKTMVEAHLRGVRNYTTEIHKVLTLELLHRTLLEDAFPIGKQSAHALAVAP